MTMITQTQKATINKYLNADEEAVRQAQEAISKCKEYTNGYTRPVLRYVDGMLDNKKFKKMVRRINNTFNNPKHGYTFKEPKLVKCVDKAPALNCHENSRKAFLMLGDKDYKLVKGYNITASGEFMCIEAEIHSVLKHIPTGEYIDFTEDYFGLKEKVFLETDFHTEFHGTYRKIIGKERPFDKIINIKKDVYDKVDKLTYSAEKQYISGHTVEVVDTELLDMFQEIEETHPIELLREKVKECKVKMAFTQEQVDIYKEATGKTLKDEVEKYGWVFHIKSGDRGYSYEEAVRIGNRDVDKRSEEPNPFDSDVVVIPNPHSNHGHLVFKRSEMGDSDFDELLRRVHRDFKDSNIIVCG